MKFNMLKNKKGMEASYIAYWILGLILLAVVIGGYIYLRKTDVGIVHAIKNLFSFGRSSG